MLILMGYMINNNNLSQLKCLIGHGIASNQQNNFYKIWYMNKVYSIILILKRVKKLFSHQNPNKSREKILGMVQNTNFTNHDRSSI